MRRCCSVEEDAEWLQRKSEMDQASVRVESDDGDIDDICN